MRAKFTNRPSEAPIDFEPMIDIFLDELHTVRTLKVFIRNNCGTDNLNGSRTGAVSSGHFIVKLGDCSGELHVSEFTVHVVSSGAGGITQPNSVILDKVSVLLTDLDAVNDFSSGLLHLVELMQIIPELGLGDDCIWGKDDHAVSLRVRVVRGGSLAAHHLILTHDSCNSHGSVGKVKEKNA